MKRITFFTSFFAVLFFTNAAFAWTLPVSGEYRVTNGFWDCARYCYHLGDDVAAEADDEILSIGAGTVVEVMDTRECGNYGGRVLIEYGAAAGAEESVVALYGHLGPNTDDPATDDIFVSVGDWVAGGQAIGRAGTREENGCFSPHLHLGIHRGAYLGYATECVNWTYAGYTAEVYEPSDACYCSILDNWYDPSEFLGVEEPDLRIVEGSVTPQTGQPSDTPFTWHLEADGGRGAAITAGVFIWNPFFQREYYFLMDYIEGTATPFEFDYTGQVLHTGEYGYRFQIRTCAGSVEDETRRSGPLTVRATDPPDDLSSDPPDPEPDPEPEPEPEPVCTPRSEICDAQDNDCDGEIDEDSTGEVLTSPCWNACGEGVYVCDWGRWLPCTAPAPQEEVCDGRDNNCDYFIDEGLYQPCETACGIGMEECVAGEWRWCTARQPTTERCNYRDDDCDGEYNEGLDCWSTPSDDPPAQPDPPSEPDPEPDPDPPSQPDPPEETPLPAPVLFGPPDGFIVYALPYRAEWSVDISWDSVPGATDYEYLIEYEEYPGIIAEEGRISGLFYPFFRTPSEYDILFLWKVRAISPTGMAGAWSVTRVFSFAEGE